MELLRIELEGERNSTYIQLKAIQDIIDNVIEMGSGIVGIGLLRRVMENELQNIVYGGNWCNVVKSKPMIFGVNENENI